MSLSATPILINVDLLMPIGKTLLLGAFGIQVFLAIREGDGLWVAFESFLVGFIAILYFKQTLDILLNLSESLSELIQKVGDPESLGKLVLKSLAEASQAPNPDGSDATFNIPSTLAQIWRLGIWGIISQVVDFCFLVALYLLEAARGVFFQVVAFLFPLVCGLYPVFPGLLKNLIAYCVELALWSVVLKLVQVTTGKVALYHMAQQNSAGVPIVAVELVAIMLILMVPSLTHRIVSGALQADLGGAAGSGLALGRSWIAKAAKWAGGRA